MRLHVDRQISRNRRFVSPVSAFGTVAALVTSLLAPVRLAAQCAMCRTALTNSAEGQRWAVGIDQGILFLLAVPFLIVVGILLVIFRAEVHAAFGLLRQFLADAATRRLSPSRTADLTRPSAETVR